MLTPHIKDENREVELKRRELEPDKFGGEPLQGDKKDKAEAELAKLSKGKK